MFKDVIGLAELKSVGKKRVLINDVALLMIYYENQVYAMSDRCPHLGASLEKGTLHEGIITCPKHGAQIDIKTGNIIEKAKVLFLKLPTKKNTTYEVKVKEDRVLVKI